MLKITRIVLSNRKIVLQLDGSVTGQWIELLRESAESELADGLQVTLNLETFALSTVKDLRLSRT
jgi:hypothetical protein